MAMLVLKALLLGAVQGITEFFPVSSAGHLALLGNVTGVEIDLFFIIMLHLGSLGAVILYFRKEIVKCFREIGKMAADIWYNIQQTFKRPEYIADEETYYRRIISNDRRRIVVMLFIASVTIAVIGAMIIPVIELLAGNVLCSGMGFFITALVLLVSSYTGMNRKGPKDAKADDSVMIGAFEAMSAFPGVSRLAMTYSSGLFRGYTKKFSRYFSFLLMIPTVIGAFLLEGARVSWSAPSVGILPAIAGAAASLVVSYYAISYAMKLWKRLPVGAFSIYCFCMGTLSVIVYLL